MVISSPDRPHQHLDRDGSGARQTEQRIIPGPISVAPSQNAMFVSAVERGGGQVIPLSEDTRGLVWLSEKRADELAAILHEHPQISWVQLPWAGVDGFAKIFSELDHDSAPLFTSAKGSYSEPVAEHALMLTLSLLRELPSKARDAVWATERTGLSLYANNIVIVGAGGITTELLSLLAPFRPNITVVRRKAEPMPGAQSTVTAAHLDDILPTADVVIVAAAATGETDKMFDERRLSLLPAHAVLVNIARGSLVDTDALHAALRAQMLWGAGLDVTMPEPLPANHPLWDEPRCVITSHSADTPLMTAHLLASRISDNVAAFMAEKPLRGIVDTRAGY